MHIVASRLFMEAHPSRALCRRWALLLFVFLPTNYHLRVYRGNCPINRPSLSTVKRDGIDRTSRVGIASLYWYGGQRRPSPDRFYKRKSQEKHFTLRRIVSDFPALLNEREWFWPSAPWTRFCAQPMAAVWIFSPRGFHRMFATTPVCSETDKRNGCQVPTMVLSEARGL